MAKKKSLAAGRRALALFLAFSLVLTMASTPPGGPVSVASATHESCSEVDEFFWVLSIGLLNDHCDSSDLSDHADELEEARANVTKLEIYNTGQQTKANSEQFQAVMGNYLQDSGSPAMAEAEAAAVAAIDANKSRSEVVAAAVDAVEDYYKVKQLNLIDQWNVTAATAITMANSSVEGTNVSADFVHGHRLSSASSSPSTITYPHLVVPSAEPTKSITLVDGNSTTVGGITMEVRWDSGPQSSSIFVDSGTTTLGGADPDSSVSGINVSSFEGNPEFIAVDFIAYKNEWDSIVSKNNQMETNAQEYAGALFDQTQNGTANVSDYISCSTLSEQYATDFETTGHYAYLVGFSACQGMAVPELENTSLMTIQTASDTYQGLLMSQNAPQGGVWEVGVTYNAANIEGKQFVATTDGEVVELDGEFSITSMEGPNGTEHQTTTVRDVNRTVTNESANYEEVQQELRVLRDEIENIEPPGGSGGGGDGGGFDFNLGSTGLVVIAAAAAAILLFGRN